MHDGEDVSVSDIEYTHEDLAKERGYTGSGGQDTGILRITKGQRADLLAELHASQAREEELRMALERLVKFKPPSPTTAIWLSRRKEVN